ncbi:MAG TPA: type IV pili methyl-accepting chemotaxis transducer N-terminal domain-containing protein, partial [Pseudomonadales bacterium]|nr:type IV pili methyl-accepting chemotaxis transducer N-terminal domain-containing protein [Pseudomonadales bacterium]
MRRFVLFCLLMTYLPLAHASLSDAEAVNKSGRERMLSQRIAKCYLMLAKQINVDEARQQLEQSVELFERQLQELQLYAKNKPTKQALAQLESAWKPFRQMALSKPSVRKAKAVVMQSDVVLKTAENLVQTIQNYSAVQTASLVNLSGRQRMLSQRIAKLYLSMYMQLTIPNLEDELRKSINQYEIALNNLSNSLENTT